MHCCHQCVDLHNYADHVPCFMLWVVGQVLFWSFFTFQEKIDFFIKWSLKWVQIANSEPQISQMDSRCAIRVRITVWHYSHILKITRSESLLRMQSKCKSLNEKISAFGYTHRDSFIAVISLLHTTLLFNARACVCKWVYLFLFIDHTCSELFLLLLLQLCSVEMRMFLFVCLLAWVSHSYTKESTHLLYIYRLFAHLCARLAFHIQA